jgi:hypothetical protein
MANAANRPLAVLKRIAGGEVEFQTALGSHESEKTSASFWNDFTEDRPWATQDWSSWLTRMRMRLT